MFFAKYFLHFRLLLLFFFSFYILNLRIVSIECVDATKGFESKIIFIFFFRVIAYKISIRLYEINAAFLQWFNVKSPHFILYPF